MITIFLGAPGSGKGTQAQHLTNKHGAIQISTGDLFREIKSQDSELGRAVAKLYDAGNLIDDELTIKVFKEKLSTVDLSKIIVLDGFPRTIKQAEALDKLLLDMKLKLGHCVFFKVSDEMAIERISNRLTCEKCKSIFNLKARPPKKAGICDNCQNKLVRRRDDEPSEIPNRLKNYYDKTSPLINFYKAKNLLKEIDANKEHQVTFKELESIYGLH